MKVLGNYSKTHNGKNARRHNENGEVYLHQCKCFFHVRQRRLLSGLFVLPTVWALSVPSFDGRMFEIVLDFAFPEIKLAIEIDGEYWHNLEKTKSKDRRRNYFLGVKKGWEVIHIPAKDFTQHSEHYVWEVIQTIETLKIA